VDTYTPNATNPTGFYVGPVLYAVRGDTDLFFHVDTGFVTPTRITIPLGVATQESLTQTRPNPSALSDLYSFEATPDLDALAEAQGVGPIKDIDDLATDLWAEGESVEDFIAAATEGRSEAEDETNA
jgi:hypothetical protein